MRSLAAAFLGLALVAGRPPAADRIDALFERIDSHIAKLGRPSGVEELARTIGGDLEKVRALLAGFEFEAYPGILKGAEGALASRSANSFDQALLAAALLSPKHRVRFATGVATPEQVRARLDIRKERPRTVLPAGVADPTDWAQARAGREAVWERVDKNVAALSELLKAKGVALAGAGPAPDLEWAWVEVERDGAWTALVEPPCAAKERFDVLPPRYLHRVEIFARLERSLKGKVATEEILRVEYPVKDLAGRGLTFQIVPAPGEAGATGVLAGKEGFRAAPLAAMRAVKRFVPSVRLGKGGQYGKAFDLDGKLYAIDASKGFSLAGAEAVGDRVGGLLGGGRRGPDAGPPTALWWGLRSHVPGKPPETWEREVVDLTGLGRPRVPLTALSPKEADRLRLAFLGSHEVRAHLGEIDAAEGILRVRRALEPWRGFFKAMREHVKGKRPLESALREFEAEGQAVTAFEVMRGSFRRELERRHGLRSWLPSAGWVVVHSEFAPVGEDKIRLRESFDIVDLPSAAEGPGAAAFRLALGVLDTELELETCDCRPPMFNTASLVRKAGAALRCLTRPEEAAGLAFKETARARVKAELEAGRVVIAPAEEIDGEAVWWRIDPKTGAALGIGETGYGQTAFEYWFEVYERMKDGIGLGQVIYCYLMAIWNNPLRWDESAGVVAPPSLIKDIIKCIPICKGLKKIFKFPSDEDPLAPFIGKSIEGELKLDANDACKAGEGFVDKVLLAE